MEVNNNLDSITTKGVNEKGEPIIDYITAELKEPLASINSIIEKYKLNDPEKNVCATWYKGKIVIGFNLSIWD
jgi:hypothetical protein